MDYTDEFAFTQSLSSMIADNLGSSQGLIGQVWLGKVDKLKADPSHSYLASGVFQSATAAKIITDGIGPAAFRTTVLGVKVTRPGIARRRTNGSRVHADIRGMKHPSSTRLPESGHSHGLTRSSSRTPAQGP